VKRHQALEALSRDHHHALVVARRLTRADSEASEAAARAFLAFWRCEGQAHFRLEEEVLLPAYAAHGDPNHPVVLQTLVDHMVIRRDALSIAEGPAVEVLIALGVQLAAHVRLEERQLFPLIERAMPDDAFVPSLADSAPTPTAPDPLRRPANPAVA